MPIKELRERQAKLVAEARERLDQIGAATDEARAAELEAQHDAAMAEHDRLDKLIEREEKLAGLERREAERRASRRPNGDDVEAAGQDRGEAPEYRQVFHKFLARGGDPGELTSEERAVLRAGVQQKVEFRTQTTAGGGGAAGGYTVPVELSNEIIKSMKAWGPMYDEAICTQMNTASGNPVKLPTVDDTAKTAEPHAEAAPLKDDGSKDVVFGKKELGAYVFDTEFIKWSMELAQDSIFNVEALLGSLLGERLGRIANNELTIGTRPSGPNGIVAASSLGTATAAAITYDDLIDLVHSVDPAYRQSPKCRFMFNDTTLASLRKLKDREGRYIWTQGDVQNGVPGSILGYGYSINQAMDAIAAGKKPAVFGDFGKYFVRKVGAPVIGVLRERFWPDLGIAGLIRFDGELGDTAAVRHLMASAAPGKAG